jgi:putative peptidoglycan lipid II flippase
MIIRATLINGASTIALALATIWRDRLILQYFGVAEVTDAYFLALTIPTLFTAVLSTAVGSAIVPVYVHTQHQSIERSKVLLRSVLTLQTAAALVLALFIALVAEPIIAAVTPGLSEPARSTAAMLLSILVMTIPLVAMSSIWTGALQAAGRFGGPAAMVVMPPAAAAIATYIWGRDFGIAAPAAGMITGTAVQMAGLAVLARAAGLPIMLARVHFSQDLKTTLRQYIPLSAGAVLTTGSLVVSQMIAATLGAGSLTTLNYGTRVTTFALLVIAGGLGVSLGPALARQAAANAAGFARDLKRFSAAGLLCSLPVTAAIVIFSRELIILIFGAEGLIATVQQLFCLQIPFYVVGLILGRGLSALLLNGILTRITIVNFLANALFAYGLSRIAGVYGVAVATSAVYFLSFCQLMYALRAQLLGRVVTAPGTQAK